MSILVPLFVLIVAVLLQALFAGYETGFISSNPIRIRYLAETEHSQRARMLLRHIQNPDAMLTTLLVGTNLAVVVSTIVVSSQVVRLTPESLARFHDLIATAIAAPVLLVVAEILPKSVFRTHPNRLALALWPAIRFFYVLLAPLVAPVFGLTRLLMRATGRGTHHISPFMASLEDVRILVDEGVDHGTIEPEEQEMIHSVIDLQTTQANEIMVPRIHIQALSDRATRRELVTAFEETGRTRIPIYHETVDRIVGIVNAYDVLLDDTPDNEDIVRFVGEVIHVPDTIKVGDLFQALKDSKQHLAIVTDEYGGTDGLVTIEDILEEIFGEIQDEFDREESRIQKVGPAAYVVDALMPLDEFSAAIHTPIQDEEVETVGGWLMHVAGYIPAQGEVITHGRFRMTVLGGDTNHLSNIRLEILPKTPEASNAEPPPQTTTPRNP